MSRRLRCIALGLSVFTGACGGGGPGGGGADRRDPAARVQAPPADPPLVAAYEPSSSEELPNAKRIAGRIAQRALTFSRGERPVDIAAAAIRTRADTRPLARELTRVVDRGRRSWAEVIYVQLAGVTETSFGGMVVLRQRTEDSGGDRRDVTRVVDVRLRRAGGPWRFDRVGSLGGRPISRPDTLSASARRAIDHPSIWMSDSSRWDIYRGRVDDRLLRRLAQVADRWPISIAVLSTGHPPQVWNTARISAHTRGAAADIFAVAGRPVIRQREQGSPAYRLAAEFVAGGAAQVGSPWVLGSGGPRSFTDAVHQDHIHVQQAELP